MKKITKVILAAALVLLVFGAFMGAAAAVGSAAGLDCVLTAEDYIQADSVQGAEIHATPGAEDASASTASRVVKIVERKGSCAPLTPLTPPKLPGHVVPAFIVTGTQFSFR